jgi:hypothetical protein
MKKSKFQIFKGEIVKRCKAQSACQPEFKRILSSETFPEIITVLKDNFNWSCIHNIIDVELIDSIKDEARECDLWANETTKTGFLLVSNATVEARGNATVEARDNATVEAWGNATVKARGNATVKAGGNATVKARGNATVEAWGNATVEAWGNVFVSSCKNIECKIYDHAIFRNTETKEITMNKGSYTVILK